MRTVRTRSAMAMLVSVSLVFSLVFFRVPAVGQYPYAVRAQHAMVAS
ncbi:MAG: hypothetical protein JO314_07085, partial [Acidobacteria bacterium]|nr:hypothetical protein [Acidobacteriota bacterium]